MSSKVSLKRIDRVLAMLSLIIEETGDERYWPVFDWLEHERSYIVVTVSTLFEISVTITHKLDYLC